MLLLLGDEGTADDKRRGEVLRAGDSNRCKCASPNVGGEIGGRREITAGFAGGNALSAVLISEEDRLGEIKDVLCRLETTGDVFSCGGEVLMLMVGENLGGVKYFIPLPPIEGLPTTGGVFASSSVIKISKLKCFISWS